MMAEAWGKLTGKPGIVMATRGPGVDQRLRRPPCRAPGFDADDPLRRPGRARPCAAARLSRRSTPRPSSARSRKWVEEIDSAERIPEIVARAFHEATSGRPGPVVVSLPEDMLRETAAVADAAPSVPVETHPGLDPDGAAPEAAVGGGAALRHRSAARAGARRRWPRSAASPSASTCRSAARSAARCSSTTTTRTMPAMSASASTRRSPGASRRPTCSSSSAAGSSEMPSSGYTLIDIPEPRQTLVHVHPGAEELGRVYRPTLAINASPTAFAAALEGLQPPQCDRVERRRRARQMPTTAPGRRRAESRPGPARRDHRLAPRAASRRCDRHQRRRQLFRLGPPLLPLPPLRHAARADLGHHGLRPAGGDRGQAPASRSGWSSPSPATAASR